MAKIWYKNSGHNSELVTQIPVKNPASSTYTTKVVYSIPLPDLFVGDLVDARAQYEISNPYTTRKEYNIMSGRGIIIGDSPTATTGIEVMENSAENIDWNMHHQSLASFGGYVVEEDMTGKYANVIGFAGAGAAYWQSGDYLQVEQDYGRFEVFVYPAEMVDVG